MIHRECGVLKTTYEADMALYPLPIARKAVSANRLRRRSPPRKKTEPRCMSPKSAQRFWDNDMHKFKECCGPRARSHLW